LSGRIFKSTLVTGTATLVSRITGLLREIFYAVMFGASAFMDAWLVAFKIPNFLRRLFAEGSFSQAFVPVISEYKQKRSQEEVRQLVDEVAGTFGVLLFIVTAIGVIAAPVIIFAFAPAWHDQPDQWHAAASMLRWTFPYLFFISLSALFSGVLNSYNRFALPAYTQVIMNIVMIIVTVWIAPTAANPGMALAMGVFVSGMLQLGFQLPAVIKLGLFRRPRWKPAAEGVRRIGKLM
jgi:putative peptidoglycan lipid II flippase